MFGHDQPGDKVLDWLSGETIEFRSIGTVYDTIHFPDGFEIPVGRPAEAYKTELKERFPDNSAGNRCLFRSTCVRGGSRSARICRALDAGAVSFRTSLVEQEEDRALVWSHDLRSYRRVHFRSQACCRPVSSVGNVWWRTGRSKLRDSRADHPALSRGSRLSRWWCRFHCGRARTGDRIGRRQRPCRNAGRAKF